MMFQVVLSTVLTRNTAWQPSRSPSPVTNTHTAWSFWMLWRSATQSKRTA